MAKKNKEFNVILKVVVETEISISADSYENALIKARELGVKDVVEFDTSFNDGSIEISGIYDQNVRIQ